MRLTRVAFSGYKRLADTACNVDGRLIALVGPNEAGKSSVLEALAWLSDEDSDELDGPLRSRSLGPLADTDTLVEVRFVLEADDLTALADLPTDDVARTYTLRKSANGSYEYEVQPPLRFRRKTLDAALTRLDRFESVNATRIEEEDQEDGPREWIDSLRRALTKPESNHSGDGAARALHGWIGSVLSDKSITQRTAASMQKVQESIETVQPLLRQSAPEEVALTRLRARVPQFLLFNERDRVLKTQYNLADRALYSDTPPALLNLLALAGTSLPALRRVQETGDVSRIRTLLKDVNKTLADAIQPTWQQLPLTVLLDIDGDMLQVLIDEATGPTTAIHERSDGLRTFIALVCFLARHRTSVAPVLMIDEAEQHLHYDAQADLIDVLLNHVATSKVIYTTHSPGCLPPDLGTGIRLVAPNRTTATSVLRNNLWDTSEPGFSPLLFAMGAGAAAFSVCRRAVLGEGPSEMILLPTLIRKATGTAEVGYQVAPGLSEVQIEELLSEAVAAKVAYLVDGDAAGAKRRTDLIESGVTANRIFRLPDGCAIEDLLTPDCYLGAFSAHLADTGWTGTPPTAAAIAGPGPLTGRLKAWAKAHRAPLPGKTAVASRLIQDPDSLVLTDKGRAALANLHSRLQAALH